MNPLIVADHTMTHGNDKMDENTAAGIASIPPSFMQKVNDAQEQAAAQAAKAETTAEKDAAEFRSNTMIKATQRLSEQADYLGRIDDALDKVLSQFVATHPLGEVLDKIVNWEDEVNRVEDRLKAIKARVSYVREVSFPARLDADETQTTTSKETGNRVTRTARIFASIISDTTGETLKKAYEWLRSNELGALIKETVNSSSLSGAAKELMENGKELPDDLFKVHTKDGVSITRGKKK